MAKNTKTIPGYHGNNDNYNKNYKPLLIVRAGDH